MRIMVFFDLPTITTADRREYNRFRKFLINDGYIMMQESVYSKLVTNYTACNLEMEKLYKNRASNGLIQALTLTEKQYAGITFITGEIEHEEIDVTNRVIVL